MKIIGILAFVIALLLSVMIHEFGHYITATKDCGPSLAVKQSLELKLFLLEVTAALKA